MVMLQDGVEVMILPDGAFCKADEEKRSPLEIDVCPFGYEFCTGDCFCYKEDLSDDMELTREQAIAEHRKMWNWIADEIEVSKIIVSIGYRKSEYLSNKKYKIFPHNDCFLCEYDLQNYESNPCENCPLEFEKDEGCLGDLFRKVCFSKTWQEQAALARQIANLPERTDV